MPGGSFPEEGDSLLYDTQTCWCLRIEIETMRLCMSDRENRATPTDMLRTVGGRNSPVEQYE